MYYYYRSETQRPFFLLHAHMQYTCTSCGYLWASPHHPKCWEICSILKITIWLQMMLITTLITVKDLCRETSPEFLRGSVWTYTSYGTTVSVIIGYVLSRLIRTGRSVLWHVCVTWECVMKSTSGFTLSLFDVSIQSFKSSPTMAGIYLDTRWCCVSETSTLTPRSQKRRSQRRFVAKPWWKKIVAMCSY